MSALLLLCRMDDWMPDTILPSLGNRTQVLMFASSEALKIIVPLFSRKYLFHML